MYLFAPSGATGVELITNYELKITTIPKTLAVVLNPASG
jgi:hypothetical protein